MWLDIGPEKTALLKRKGFDVVRWHFVQRVMAHTVRASVDDVWFPEQGAWVQYTGDRQEPYSFGNQITVKQLLKDARGASEEPTKAPLGLPLPPGDGKHRNLINLTKQAQGDAFQILAAPPKSSAK